MSGVWVFGDNGVMRLKEKRGEESSAEGGGRKGSGGRRRALVHVPTNEEITSYAVLKKKLTGLGWEKYYEDGELLQFHKPPSVDLISLPKHFTNLKSRHMYDIVVKTRNVFEVRDM